MNREAIRKNGGESRRPIFTATKADDHRNVKTSASAV
jgi:hypothetical protein